MPPEDAREGGLQILRLSVIMSHLADSRCGREARVVGVV
jgi:hypothetical protein